MATRPSGWGVGIIAYWLVAVFLTVFGILALASIGAPFLVLGVTMIAVSPFRRRPAVFWPVIVGMLVFCATFLLVHPFECERTEIEPAGGETEDVEAVEHATCSSLLGIQTSGIGDYEPSLLPAFLIGVGAGGLAAAGTLLVVRRRSSSRS